MDSGLFIDSCPFIVQGRARQLFKAGYKNIRQIAFATPEELCRVVEHLPKKVARDLVTSAKVIGNR